MKIRHMWIYCVAYSLLILPGISNAEEYKINKIGQYFTGIFDDSAMEIGAYDPASKTFAVVSGGEPFIWIMDLSKPQKPKLIAKIDFSPYGAPNSVAIAANAGVFAFACENIKNRQKPGKVVFIGNVGIVQSSVTVGPLPDMVTFSPDEMYALVGLNRK